VVTKFKGFSFERDQFALPKPIAGVTETDWVTSRREFLKSLPDTERNIILTGDPEQIFDPVSSGSIPTLN
jgi:hypothetical protein